MNDIEEKLRAELGEGLKTNVLFRDHSSLGVGGPSEYFFEAKDIDSFARAVMIAYELGIPYFVFGGGYNIVPSDSGFHGLTIKNSSKNIAFSADNSEVIVDSGVNLGTLINMAAGRDLGGLEFLCGIPGTVGGAIYGNAGAFNYEIGNFVRSVVLLMPKEDKMAIVQKQAQWFNFAYRSSKLKADYKEEKNKPIILTAKIQLVRRRNDEILSLLQKNIRTKRESQPISEKSAGSFFKNPGLGKERSAGYLLDTAGGKKLRVGGAAVSRGHANFLINRKNATANDFKELSEKLKDLVWEKNNIKLEEEVEFVGRW